MSCLMSTAKVTHEYLYEYIATETHFDEDVEQSFDLKCHVKISCESGEYNNYYYCIIHVKNYSFSYENDSMY